jgi:hypothetical protein
VVETVKSLIIGPFALHLAIGHLEPEDMQTLFTLTHVASGYAIQVHKSWAFMLDLLESIDAEQIDFSFTTNAVPDATRTRMTALIKELRKKHDE